MKNPYIPEEKGNLFIIDGRVSSEILDNIKGLDVDVIPTVGCTGVPDPISYHPDIAIHPVNHHTLVIAPNVFDYYSDKLSGKGIKLIRGETKLGKNYSEHVAYNVGRIGDFAIHNFQYTDRVLKYFLEKEGISFIHINQGYTKCSLMIVDVNAGITADLPMFNKLTNVGADMLLIDAGYIELKDYSYGFIGGASGNYSKDDIMISGSLVAHPDKNRIFNFFKKYKKRVIHLSNKRIVDIGTIISLYCQ